MNELFWLLASVAMRNNNHQAIIVPVNLPALESDKPIIAFTHGWYKHQPFPGTNFISKRPALNRPKQAHAISLQQMTKSRPACMTTWTNLHMREIFLFTKLCPVLFVAVSY